MAGTENREAMLQRDGYLIALAITSLLSGMNFSPYFEPGFILLRPLLVNLFITSPVLVFYFTSLFVSLAALVIAGVPAAIFERVTSRTHSDATSMLIWVVGAAILAIPAVLRLVGMS